MEIPVSPTFEIFGIVLFGFGLVLVLAGLDVFTIQQVSVQKGPKTWELGIRNVILGIVLLYTDISPSIAKLDPASNQEIMGKKVSQTTEEIINTQEGVNDDATWK